MEGEKYTQEGLQKKKYGELLKIGKTIGLKTSKRLKTDKLIEAILECQADSSISEDAATVVAALADAIPVTEEKEDSETEKSNEEEGKKEEELLCDIQFPESLPLEAEELEKKEDRNPNKRRRTDTYEIDKKVEGAGTEEAPPTPARQKTSTFEIPKNADRHSSTDDASPSVDQKQTEDNSQQLTLLTQKLSDKKQLRKSSSVESPAVTKTGLRQRKSLVKTNTPSSARKSQAWAKLPGSSLKDTQGTKPVFTIGSKDDTAGKEGSKPSRTNIPRFVSYARKLNVPNFAKIHERAFDRMEALDDYVGKKRNRTTTSSSVTKKPQVAPEEVFKPTVFSTKNLNLNFSSSKTPANKTPTFIRFRNKQVEKSKLANTPTPKTEASRSGKKTSDAVSKISPKVSVKSPRTGSKSAVKPQKAELKSGMKSPKAVKISGSKTQKSPKSERKSAKLQSPKASAKKTATASKKSPKPGPTSKKSPKPGPTSKKSPNLGRGTTSKGNINKKTSPSGRPSALPKPLKENVKPAMFSPAASKNQNSRIAATPSSLQKRKTYDPKATANKPVGYVPYKGSLKPVNRAALKNLAEKKPNLKSSSEIRESQRKILKGVRINKRFELQMAKRGIAL